MKMEIDLQGVDGVLKLLRSLPPEVVSKNGGPVRLALAKAARVIRDEARRNFVSQIGRGGQNYSTGFTAKNIVAKRKRMIPGVSGEKFIMTVNYKIHPGGSTYKKRPFRSNDAAFIMEYGTAKQEPRPWLRPAFETKKMEAIEVAKSELLRRLDLIVSKLSAQNKGR
jgi:HK97 gp10 family phage protein